ncbi:S1C family serine protease [Knoellia subterranea]|uniref:Protease n=1 Tax=Knoellia subterranea KCTC 19937 TaxID=1385521 RepID=A0A0A0JTL7_9MICO|nr:trypsin-like peptidase domain-containing protein [Knoellia subterranea]KGN39427.1 protease [Knoellia subterranea KCTC 19937]
MTEDSGRPDDADRPHVDPEPTEEVDLSRTLEVDLSRTQEFGPAPGQAPRLPVDESAEASAQTAWTAWAHEPSDRSTQAAPSPYAPPAQNPYAASGPHATSNPYASPGSYAAPTAHHQDPSANPYALSTPAAAPARERRGPGWLAVFLIAGLTALLAGLGGGLLGGWLGSSDRLDGFDPVSSGATPEPGPGATTRPDGSVANIAAKAIPSVVTIRVEAADGDGTGSGWVLDDKGHIVTNNHVVSSAANGGEITVVLTNGKQSKAEIVGRDVSYDLAVLKVDRTDLTPLPLGDSTTVVVGDPVIAVGAPLGLESTVTTGIISALNRPVTPGEANDQSFINAIQTDAAINPGNSGGPLLDMEGRVIGINSAIARVAGNAIGGQSGNIGVGFAIPSAQVKITVDQLIRTGKAEHPIIGVLLDREYQGEGVRIATDSGDTPAVTPGGPADKAGLKAGDVITAFEGRPMADPDALVVAIRSKPVGSTVTLTVVRDGASRDVKMVLQGRSN